MVDYTDWDQYIASMNKGTAAGVIQRMLDHVFHSGSRGSVW